MTDIRSREDAEARLVALNTSIAHAVLMLRLELPTIQQFQREHADIESFGPVLAPALFLDTERQQLSEIVSPVYAAAEQLVTAYDEAARKLPALRGEQAHEQS